MPHGSHKHAAQLPFVDFHCTPKAGGGFVIEGILPFDTVENLAVGLGLDASKSFQDEYGASALSRLLGLGRNQVADASKLILPYLIEMDASKSAWVAYWAAGYTGQRVMLADSDEMTLDEMKQNSFAGPNGDFGSGTYFLPAIRAFVDHLRQRISAGEKIDKALLACITDGQWHDLHEVGEYIEQMEAAIARGDLPKIVVSVVGVGDGVSEDMLEELLHDAEHEDAPNVAFCYNMLAEMPDLSAVVAHLADANMFAWNGGMTIKDQNGNLLRAYEDNVPVFIELQTAADVEHLEITSRGQTWEVELDEDDDHGHADGDHDGDHDADHEPAGHGAHH